MHITICYHYTQGLHHDANVIKKTLCNYNVNTISYPERDLYVHNDECDSVKDNIVIFLEHIHSKYMKNKYCIFFPNNEHLNKYDIITMNKHIDIICCKSLNTESYIKTFIDSRKVVYTGFVSLQTTIESCPKEEAFLHIKGVSSQKNTEILVNTWLDNPSWPMLHIVQQNDYEIKQDIIHDNIRITQRFLSRNKLSELISKYTFHICPSSKEGFGHSICEPLASGGIVITSDYSPMNEIINSQCGNLIPPYLSCDEMGINSCTFEQINIEKAVEQCLGYSPEEIIEKQKFATKQYINLHERFTHNIKAIIELIYNDGAKNL